MAVPFNQSTTAQKVIDNASLHTSLQSYFGVGGVSNEPGMMICNNVIQMLLVRPLPWKFNRKELCGPERGGGNFLVTQYGVQDYRFGGAVAFALNSGVTGTAQTGGAQVDLATLPINGGSAGITIIAGVATVQTIDPHPFQVGTTIFMSGNMEARFNSTYTFDPVLHNSAWAGGFVITAVPDNLHFKFAAPASTSATITNIALASNVLTVTAVNSYTIGQRVLFAGLTTNTFLNGTVATLTAATGTNFTATVQHADVGTGADTGTATLTSGAPGFGTLDSNGNLIGLFPFGWMESAWVQNINATQFPQSINPINAVRELPVSYSMSGNKLSICMLADFQNGVLKFRISEPMGTQCQQINMVYQARCPKMVSPQDIFPWPDDMAYVLHELALFQCFRYAKGINANDTKMQMQVAQGMVQLALAGEDREDNAFPVAPEMALMRG